jgi:serine/threonine-protein kinase ULK/ATG1
MIVDDITLMERIGKGSFGEVYITKRKNSNIIYATKKVPKSLAFQDKIKRYFNNEIFILKNISHPNIIRLHEIKQTINNFYLVFDYCNGGTITNCLELFKKKFDKPFTEEVAQYILKKIVDGLYYLHKNKIIHRDLKLDNVLIQFFDDQDRKNLNILKSEIKIIDFGFARYLNEDDLAQSLLGSPINMDPGILKKLKDIDSKENFGYDDKADIWSLGTIAYEILIGVPPFDATSYDELLRKINKGEYTIPKSLKLSKQSISFLNGLLQDDPKKRLGIDDIIYHEFLTLEINKFDPIDLTNMNKDITLSIKDNKNGVWSLFETPGNDDISKIPSQLYSKSPYVEKLNVNVLKKDQQEDYIGSLMNNLGELKIEGR